MYEQQHGASAAPVALRNIADRFGQEVATSHRAFTRNTICARAFTTLVRALTWGIIDSTPVLDDLTDWQSHIQRRAVHLALHVHDDNRIGALADAIELFILLSASAVVRC